jgi:GAF domain-containing protein
VSLISLVDEDRQFFKSQVGLSGDVADARQTPLTHSFCQHVANARRPLVVADSRQSALLAGNLAIRDLDVIAYLGVPVAAPDGHVIGALCAIDHEPHDWTDEDVRVLSSLAEVVSAEVASHSSNTRP